MLPAPTSLAKPYVLVVEDEAALVTMLRYNLEKQGFRVEEAVDGQEALTRIAEANAADVDAAVGRADGLAAHVRVVARVVSCREEVRTRGVHTCAGETRAQGQALRQQERQRDRRDVAGGQAPDGTIGHGRHILRLVDHDVPVLVGKPQMGF